MRENWFRIFVVLFLLLIPFYWVQGFPLFESFPFPFFGGSTYWGLIVYLVLLFGFIWWFATERIKGGSREKLLSNLGFRRDWLGIIVGLVVGGLTGVLLWFVGEGSLQSSVASSFSNSLGLIHLAISTVIVAPLVEEILFRGYLINKLTDFKSGMTKVGVFAVFASIILFAFVHIHNPSHKLIGGTVFTLAYVWGWKNNLAPAIITHSTANSTIFLIAYSQLGITTLLITLSIIIALLLALILIIQNINQIFRISEKVAASWMRLIRKS